MNMDKSLQVKDANTIPVISFFTGGGFLDMGFEKAGFNIVWTNEFNTSYADFYSFGMTAWRKANSSSKAEAKITSTKSINQIYGPDIIKEAFKGEKPPLFGSIGGPPCTDFSSGGKHNGSNGKNGKLTRIYVNRICSIMPSFFVLENVPGLYRTKKHRHFLNSLMKKLESRDYCLDVNILNSLDFGLPQDRERFFMVGIKRNIVKKCLGRIVKEKERNWFPWPEPKYKNAKQTYPWPDVVNNGAKPTKPSSIPTELMVHSLFNKNNDPAKLPNGNDYFNAYSKKFGIIKEGDTHRKSFKRLHRYRFSPTACYGHNEVHLHPWEKRRLSVREAMRIQGIPDTYILPEDAPLSTKFKLVSNGVPVPLSHVVAKSLMAILTK